jgi:hypothetical protein
MYYGSWEYSLPSTTVRRAGHTHVDKLMNDACLVVVMVNIPA